MRFQGMRQRIPLIDAHFESIDRKGLIKFLLATHRSQKGAVRVVVLPSGALPVLRSAGSAVQDESGVHDAPGERGVGQLCRAVHQSSQLSVKHLALGDIALLLTASVTTRRQVPAGSSPHACTVLNGQLTKPIGDLSCGLVISRRDRVPAEYQTSRYITQLQLLSMLSGK